MGKLQAIQSADATIAGLVVSTKKYNESARRAVDALAVSWQRFADTARQVGVSKPAQSKITQVTNLIKEAKKGYPLRAYHPYNDERPVNKAIKVIGLRRGPAKGLVLALAGSPLLQVFRTDVLPAFQNVQDVCTDWHQLAQNQGDQIRDHMQSIHVLPEPFGHGFKPDPVQETWAAAQRPFAKESNRLRDIMIHNAIGLPGGTGGFQDCADVDACLGTLVTTNNELLRLHKEFGRTWADYEARHEGKYSGQGSLS